MSDKPQDGKADPWDSPRSIQAAETAPPSAEDTPSEASQALKQRVQQLLDQQINPAVASHGGHIGLVDVKENKVYVQMSGGCQGCGAARITLKAGVERVLREEIPEIEEVIDATDHTGATAPYYSPSE